MKVRLQQSRATIDHRTAQLESLSPLRVLGRGYSLTQRLSDGRLLLRSADANVGDRLQTRLAEGTVISRVEEIQE